MEEYIYLDLPDMQNVRLLVGFLGEKAQMFTHLEDPGMIPVKIHICTFFHACFAFREQGYQNCGISEHINPINHH